MLTCWWRRLAERHDEAAGVVEGGAARSAENSPYTPRMACIRMTLRQVLDSQMENCVMTWRNQRRPMTREEKALKLACIDAYALAASGGAESSEAVTARYSQCEHGFVLISGTVDTTLQPQCERPECMRLAVVPPEAAAYHAATSGGASGDSPVSDLRAVSRSLMPPEADAYHAATSGGANGDGPVNQTESGGAGMPGQMYLGVEVDTCKICDEEADERCQGEFCTGCCESNRGTWPFQCCDGCWVYGEWSSDEPTDLVPCEDSDEPAEAFTVGHGGTNGARSREAATLLKANALVERRQIGDGNCMFRSLSEAVGKRAEYHRELRRKVVDRMRAEADEEGVDSIPELGTWGSSKALRVAADVMQVRMNVVTLDGAPGKPVEVQTVGDYGPVVSVALYSQHMNTLVKKEVRLRCDSRDVRAVRNNGMLLVTSWRVNNQKVKAKAGRRKAEWKQDLEQTGHRVPVEGLSASVVSATSAATTTACMVVVAAAIEGKTVRQKWNGALWWESR